MPLTDIERRITQTVLKRFLELKESTPRKLLIRQFRSLEPLQRLTNFPILKKVNRTGSNEEEFLPLALAFHYSEDPDTVTRARTSIEIVLRVLQNLFDVELDKTDFTPTDVEAHAAKMYDNPPARSVIQLGLYLAQEFGVLAGWSCNQQQTELASVRIAESIVEMRDFAGAWDAQIARTSKYVEEPPEARTLESVVPAPGHGEPSAGLPSARISKSKTKRAGPKVFRSPFEAYTVGDQIGCGGSGIVFKAKDSEGRLVALKVLDRSKAPTTKLKRFKNEIQFCSRPSSKHIVKVLDYGSTEDGSLFYVMPYYPSTLRDLIKAGIKNADVLPLFSQILDGVEAAHLLDVCHRDIKPENILYERDTNTVVLGDFGIARFKEDDLLTSVHTGPNDRLANFAYAAPEQRSAGSTVDHRADIYALGMILNEMYTGTAPHGTGIQRIAGVAPDCAYLDDLVEVMMRQKADQRPSSVAEVKEELIARGHRFVELQKLDAMKRQVLPESELNDPLIANPIRPVSTEDYDHRTGTLTVKLNMAVNGKWEECFRRRATRFSANVSSAIVRFDGDRALITVSEHFMQEGVNFLKEYCVVANDEYASVRKQEHQKELDNRSASLRRVVAEAEAKKRVLEKIQI
jgi:serine/threonine protein kinase